MTLNLRTVDEVISELNSPGTQKSILKGAILLSLISPQFISLPSVKNNFNSEPNRRFQELHKGDNVIFSKGKISLSPTVPKDYQKVQIGKYNVSVYVDDLVSFASFLGSRMMSSGLNEDLEAMKPIFEGGPYGVIKKEDYLREIENRKKGPQFMENVMIEPMLSFKYMEKYKKEIPWTATRYPKFINNESKLSLKKESVNEEPEEEIMNINEGEVIEETIDEGEFE